jgi:polysaccharide export outer membrane protein
MKILMASLIILFSSVLNAEKLTPGDGIRITAFNIAEEINGDYFVQANGNVQLPYIGEIRTDDMDYEQIKKEIFNKYDSLYRGVELIILPLFRVSVLGEVRNPGVYFVTGVEKLLDVIALAGGETADSDMSEIYIERKDKEFVIDGEKIIESQGEEKDFYLQSGDRIFVSRKWGAGSNTAILLSAAGLIVAILALFVR